MRLGPALALLVVLASPSWARSEFDKLVRAGLKSLKDDDAVQAEVALKRAARLQPENADIHAALALALALGHDRPEAIVEYRRALQLDRRWVDGRKMTDMMGGRGWLHDAPAAWDGEQDQLAIEVFNGQKIAPPAVKGSLKPTLTFPKGWAVTGDVARPDDINAAHARMTFEGGEDTFKAEDPEDWFVKAREASPDHYRWFKQLDKRSLKRGDAPGVQVLYTVHPPRYREDFEVLDVILLKDGQYRRATYEAPVSEFKPLFETAYAALETLKFK